MICSTVCYGRTKWPATYTRYLALGMQLPPALQSPISFHLGCGYTQKKKSIYKRGSTRPHLNYKCIMYWMPMPTGIWENPQFYGQWTVEDSQNWVLAKSLWRRSVYQLGFQVCQPWKSRFEYHLKSGTIKLQMAYEARSSEVAAKLKLDLAKSIHLTLCGLQHLSGRSWISL